jgi:hypothetical protein
LRLFYRRRCFSLLKTLAVFPFSPDNPPCQHTPPRRLHAHCGKLRALRFFRPRRRLFVLETPADVSLPPGKPARQHAPSCRL